MFLVRWQDAPNGPFTQLSLHPGPTDPAYPEERRKQTLLTTQDENVVVQRPLRDPRMREWVWVNARPTHLPYEDQWKVLESLEYRARLRAGKVPTVQVWEDVTDAGGFGRVDAQGNRVWTTVKALKVQRTPRKGGGTLVYETSVFGFVVADSSFDWF